jgi:hypothetical protein
MNGDVLIDPKTREHDDRYLTSRFTDGRAYCIAMRVPIVNKGPRPPDLSKRENRLAEWPDGGSEPG